LWWRVVSYGSDWVFFIFFVWFVGGGGAAPPPPPPPPPVDETLLMYFLLGVDVPSNHFTYLDQPYSTHYAKWYMSHVWYAWFATMLISVCSLINNINYVSSSVFFNRSAFLQPQLKKRKIVCFNQALVTSVASQRLHCGNHA